MTWKRFYDERPPNERGIYRWRVGERSILGMNLVTEWTDVMHLCGMGYSENEWWPECSSWDGWNRTVDKTLEWRPLEDDEIPSTMKEPKPWVSSMIDRDSAVFHGLDLLPCPFTGKQPKVIPCSSGYNKPYLVESFTLSTFMGKTYWHDAKKMQDAWNTRKENQCHSFSAYEHLRGF